MDVISSTQRQEVNFAPSDGVLLWVYPPGITFPAQALSALVRVGTQLSLQKAVMKEEIFKAYIIKCTCHGCLPVYSDNDLRTKKEFFFTFSFFIKSSRISPLRHYLNFILLIDCSYGNNFTPH